ncbi:F0F1 ATP synthase subunit B [Actinomyces glycerinitolerans]|uniref:ATP synthase subunit b n=1 Tax=Actinomyces glycerinitolerans TaxID=1892869 RepID=A0A1M4RXZ0_9ACTO|nr:F0F1 ATP synthase subunit B [Actinomyces glycerinitolerans]SHE24865.1 atpase f0 complex subunit b/b' bacterial/chloroplast [Actinomyces glycerinitolerans]
MSVGTVVLPAAGTQEGIGLFIPDLADLVWGTICFLIIAVVLIKYALPRFNAVLDERTAKIEEGLALTEKAKEEQSGAEARAARLVEDARLEAAKIRENAQAEADKIIADARAEAAGEAGRAMEAAERQIQADKQAAQISLRSDVGLLATDLAEKLVGEHLSDTELSGRVIDRFLDELENAPVSPAWSARAGSVR